MLSPFRSAGVITAIFAVCGSARSQELAPPGTGVSIHKLTINTALSRTVKYTVKGGSPRLQALVRRVEWAENELSVVEQLQQLKLDTVIYERQAMTFRAAQLTPLYFPTGSNSYSRSAYYGGHSETSLQRGLGEQLAYEATPQVALNLIGFLEQVQTELEAQLKALPPQEKKEAEGPIAALRPRVAALSRADIASPPTQPVVYRRAQGSSRVDQPLGTTRPGPASAGAKAAVEVEWHGTWYAAEILRVSGGSSLIHYKGYESSWDEWVPPERIRPARGPQ